MCWCFFRRPKEPSWVYNQPLDTDWEKHMWETN